MNITWAIVKLFFSKAWLFIKHYWAFFVLGLGLVYVLLLVKNKQDALDQVTKQMQDLIQQHHQELDALQAQHEQDLAENQRIEDQYNATIQKVQQQYAQTLVQLDNQKQQQIHQIIVNNPDPESQAKLISQLFGGIPILNSTTNVVTSTSGSKNG